jgi:hypothetical protein
VAVGLGDLVAGRAQLGDEVPADETCRTGDEGPHADGV